MSNDVNKDINDEWIKLLNHVGKIAPDDLVKIQNMNEEYGEIPKNLFEQGYRSGFNVAAILMRKTMEEEDRE